MPHTQRLVHTLPLIALVALSCRREAPGERPAMASAQQPRPAATAVPSRVAPQAPGHDAEDLVGLAQGALVVVRPPAIESGHAADLMIDEDPGSSWVTPEGQPTGQPVVIALAGRSSISRLQLDEAQIGLDTHSPKQVRVELSDTSPTDGFRPIAEVTLPAANADGESFPADPSVEGRWLRLTVVSNYGAAITEIPELRAFGQRLGSTPLPDLTGTWKTDAGDFHLTQSGTTVTGCYDGGAEPLIGGVEGHVVKFHYQRDADAGPGILVFSSDAQDVFGGYWKTNGVEAAPHLTPFAGKRASGDAGHCPGEHEPGDEMAAALEHAGRLRLYGVNFDSDSDRLRDESHGTLDLVAEVLARHADWHLMIEGHTDATADPGHNQQLSEARAAAVKAYLMHAGVDGARLVTRGLGARTPVASNDTPLGRAANRRVELVRG